MPDVGISLEKREGEKRGRRERGWGRTERDNQAPIPRNNTRKDGGRETEKE